MSQPTKVNHVVLLLTVMSSWYNNLKVMKWVRGIVGSVPHIVIKVRSVSSIWSFIDALSEALTSTWGRPCPEVFKLNLYPTASGYVTWRHMATTPTSRNENARPTHHPSSLSRTLYV